ncbi:ATP-dependent DNA helicase DinG [Thermosyntropha lipolytica DSM 11003]|uniref:DNA 5'-3' helicase n=1 Tax=Thermosyntropha lipolytica DSM 11003 TaxID=1123382 RepID=A0A1M5PG69_9FIRM|nr:helicase C-terminal domain-containing protein [Thermosyntropha lipolytica]SHH00263.1 ATP-dependent DNA helicase DinG [Thermosyntropha lipolytica DSM 11003]
MTRWMDDVESIFKEDSRINQILPDYVYREEQVNLSLAIARALEKDEFLVAEAGTGIGKSFAYLIPAVLWAVQTGKKVVISTKTKALQQQIVEKDLPALRKILDLDFSYAEAKGRENFLCWNKYHQIIAGKKRLEKEELELIEKIMRWAEETTTGDRKEVMVEARLLKKWGIVSAERQTCFKENCPHQEKCFRMKMIKKVHKADIVVTNHAFLLADIMVENRVLPEYEYLIIDEAHSFEREAFDKLSVSLVFSDLEDLLYALYYKDAKWEKGYLTHLKRSFPLLQMLIGELEMLVDKGIQLTAKVKSWLDKNFVSEDDTGFSKVLGEKEKNRFLEEDFLHIYLEWYDTLQLICFKMEDLQREMEVDDEGWELTVFIRNLEQELDKIFTLLEEDIQKSDKIIWLQFYAGRVRAISSSSIATGEILYEKLYLKLKSLVMVSATLAVEGDFSYFISKSGLLLFNQEGRLNTLIEKSPFMYEEQAFMYILEDMPFPDNDRFNEELAEVVSGILDFLPGRILILFTSQAQMKKAARLLRPICDSKGVKLLVQNEDGEAASLVNEYITCPNAVLMGLDTFWEGIDLKGELLKCLIITKLPFRSPDEPFARAASLYFSLQGQNTFTSFMLPDAVIRFKQGVGRLIRSEQDRGIIIVLDSRLEKKAYGSIFKNNTPVKNIKKLSQEEFKRNVAAWLGFIL